MAFSRWIHLVKQKKLGYDRCIFHILNIWTTEGKINMKRVDTLGWKCFQSSINSWASKILKMYSLHYSHQIIRNGTVLSRKGLIFFLKKEDTQVQQSWVIQIKYFIIAKVSTKPPKLSFLMAFYYVTQVSSSNSNKTQEPHCHDYIGEDLVISYWDYFNSIYLNYATKNISHVLNVREREFNNIWFYT